MSFFQFKRLFFIWYLFFWVSTGFQPAPPAVWAQADHAATPPSPGSPPSSLTGQINTHWGGRLKVSGFVSWPDKDSIYEPVGTGTFYDGGANLRLTNETFFTDSIFSDIQYELIGAGGDSIKKQNQLREQFPNIPSNLFYGGTPLTDDARLMDLTDVIKDQENWFLLQRLDRLNVAFLPRWGSLRIGRQAITWGNGLIFNPMDLFNPFPPTAIDRDYKVGDDMLNAQFALSQTEDLQVLYVVRRDPDTENVEFGQASLAAKLHFATGTTEFDVMASKHYEDVVAGIGSRGYLGNAAWRVDGTWTFLNSGGNYLSLVSNMDYSWVWLGKNFYGFVEYFFNGLGRNDYSAALLDADITERLERGELFVLDKNYVSGYVQIELHPLVKLSLTAINNIQDPSGILQPFVTWDILQNLQMTGGANLYYGGNGSEYGGFAIPGTQLRTQSPNSAFLWLIYYF